MFDKEEAGTMGTGSMNENGKRESSHFILNNISDLFSTYRCYAC